uniref:C2H2-type domain-containing protein n=1 Tax=Strongyloides papillosus TaxID=174720 RepID=A0A0N5BMF5_STREA
MSYCEINTAQPNQLTTMDESIDSGNVRRSLRSNVRCNYKDMINGTKKNSNAIDRSRSLSAGKKLKIKPVIPKKNQTCGEVSCNSSHNNSSDVNNTFRTTKSASHTTTTDDEATTNSNQSLSVSPENNIHHVIEVSISTTDPTTNSKRHRRPPSAHKDYLNEKQVKEIQKSHSKNPSKSLTPDPNTVLNSSKLLSSDNTCKKVDNNNLNKSNQTQKHEIANEIQKKVNNTMNNTSNILEVEINKDISGDEPRCSLSPPLKMSITRGKGSVSPKIISFTVNETDTIVKEDQSLQGANKNETKSDVIPTIPVEENEVLPTVEEIKEFSSHSNEDETTDNIDPKDPIPKELTGNISTDSIDLKCSENPALLQIDGPETAETSLVEEVPNEKLLECPTLQCMDEHTNPPKLELENNEQKPELEPVLQDTSDQQEESTTTSQPMDTSGPPLLEPVEEGPKEDSYEDLDLKCHEDLELMDLDTPKKVDVGEEETETMETTTSPTSSTKTGKRRNCPPRKETPTGKIETKTSGRRSYSRNSDKYKCKECGFTTGRMVDLKLHNKTHENSNMNRGTSAKRRKRSHSVPKQDTALNESPKEEAETGDKEKEIEFDKLYSVEEYNLESGTKDGSPSHEKMYKCKECPFTNTNLSRIESHVVGHTKRIGFKCPVCTYFCGSAGFMKKHTSLHGTDCPWPPQFYGSKKRGNGRYQTPPPTLTKDEEGLKKEVGDEETSKEYSQQQSSNSGDNKKSTSQGGNNKRGGGGSQVVPLTDDMRTIWKSMNIQKKVTKQTCPVKTCPFTGTSISFSLHKLLYTHNKDKVKSKTRKPAPLDKVRFFQ